MERNPMKVNNVEKPLSPESIQIHERVQRERPMKVNSMMKPSVISVPFRHTKDCTQERHCI